ncbi:MAG TPA: methylated-DNA--[protein]-cysteine S-methyltransferase [Polyangiaceae bacterium]|nr:methylated-DNA--[protein]-cysteine S-methyltransferase [Polyangiaceae bacterium]
MEDVSHENYTLHRMKTPIGVACVVTDERGALLAFDWADTEARMHGILARRGAGKVRLVEGRAPDDVRAALERYFDGEIRAIDGLRCAPSGTPFQETVWAALRAIPAGTTTTYGELATRIGAPGAARAVGLANNKNPVGVVVPCHRVIGADGSLTGYAGGLARKQWLLEHEARAAGQPWIASTARASSTSSGDSFSMRAMSAR